MPLRSSSLVGSTCSWHAEGETARTNITSSFKSQVASSRTHQTGMVAGMHALRCGVVGRFGQLEGRRDTLMITRCFPPSCCAPRPPVRAITSDDCRKGDQSWKIRTGQPEIPPAPLHGAMPGHWMC